MGTSYMSDSKKKIQRLKQLVNFKVFSKKEIAAFVILFITLGVILFPKSKISYLIRDKEHIDNYGLSKTYLKSIFKIDSNNKEVGLLLIENDINLGNLEEAQSILEKFEKNKILTPMKISDLKYKILKQKFFGTKDKEKKKEMLTKIKTILKERLNSAKTSEEIKSVIKDSESFNLPEITYAALTKLYINNQNDKELLEKLRKYALSIGKYDDYFYCTNKLIAVDPKNKKRYLKESLKIAIATNNKKQAAYYEEKIGKKEYLSDEEISQLINLYLSENNYKKAFELAYFNFLKDKNGNNLKKAIDIALWNRDYEKATKLIDRYGSAYLGNPKMAEYLLKISTGINNRTLAVRLAKKAFELYGEGK